PPAPSPPTRIAHRTQSSPQSLVSLHPAPRQKIPPRLRPEISSSPRSSGSILPIPSAACRPECPPSSSSAFPSNALSANPLVRDVAPRTKIDAANSNCLQVQSRVNLLSREFVT